MAISNWDSQELAMPAVHT